MKNHPTAEGVHEWAVAHDVPYPGSFAVRYWYFDGKTTRLKLAAAFWCQLVKRRATGFPAIDEG